MGGNFDLRWTARSLQEAVFKHDVPAVYCRWVQGLRIHGLELEWGENLPEYFSDGIDCEQFRDVGIDQFEGRQAQTTGGAALSFADGAGLSITGSTAAPGTTVFASVSHVSDRRAFVNYDLSAARHLIAPAGTTFYISASLHRTTPAHLNPPAPTPTPGKTP